VRLGFKTEKFLIATEMDEFRIRIRLFDRSINLFLNKIWIEFDGNLDIDHFCSRWWGELERYGEKLRVRLSSAPAAPLRKRIGGALPNGAELVRFMDKSSWSDSLASTSSGKRENPAHLPLLLFRSSPSS
jgi:hypothetical protein